MGNASEVNVAGRGLDAHDAMRSAEAAERENAAPFAAADHQRKLGVHTAPSCLGTHIGAGRRTHVHANIATHCMRFHILLEHVRRNLSVNGPADEAEPPRKAHDEVDAEVI